jgi:hypothetical protein
MKLFLYGIEEDDLFLGTESPSYLVQIMLASETGETTAVIKTTSSLPGAANSFANSLLDALSELI